MKGTKKCQILLLVVFFCVFSSLFISSFFTSNASAATSISSILASQSTFSKNFIGTVYTQTLNSQSLPAQVLGADANMTGFWHYRLNYVFANPVTNHSGTGYNHTVYFTLYSNYDIVNSDLNHLMGNVAVSFEGIPANQNYCTSSYDITSLTNNSVRFRVTASCPYNSFSTNQNFQNVQVVVDYTPDSLFWCANDSAKLCPTGVPYIYLSNVDYNFELLIDAQDSYNQTIINQNQTIINQNQQTYDWLTDNSDPNVDASGLGSVGGWLPAGPVDSILTLPVVLAQGILGVFTGTHTCSPIVLPFDFINSSITIPCLDSFFTLSGVNLIWNGVGAIISGFIIYDTFKWLYKFVDDTLTLRENNSSMWGGL